MYKCPQCGKETISGWKKSQASRFRPAKCSSCGGLSYVPIKYGWGVWYLLSMPLIVIWTAVYFFGSGWPLIAVPPFFIWAVVRNTKRSPLVPKY